MKICTRSVVITAALAGTLGFGSLSTAIAADAPATAAKAPTPKPKANVSKDDLDLWAFSTVNATTPGKTVADFRALPNLASEKRDELRGVEDQPAEAAPDAPPPAEAAPPSGPASVRFLYSDGVDLRVMDYGDKAFVSHLRINGPGRVVLDPLKIGSTRDEVLAVLGRPTRGGGSYAVYEGKNDVIRVFYTATGTLSSVEIDRGD